MYRNHIADRVCMGDYKSVDEVAGDVKSLTFDVKEIMMLITERPIWYWATMDGQPTLKNFDDIRAADAERTYLEGRDLRRSIV